MLAVRIRSGLIETRHDGAVAAVGADGTLLARAGDIDEPFYLRSAAKPFQALVALENGANLAPQQLALACASHDGDPVHLAMVSRMLDEVGLDESALRCPPSWPIGGEARDLQISEGARERRIFHNCSGKHAAWLRACVASGWPTESYLTPDHPLQVRIRRLVEELGGHPVDPVGVDGCGAPVLRTTVRAMASMFARLGSDDRLAEVFRAMHTYPALVSGNGNGDATLAMSVDGAAKRGAAGCIGMAWRHQMGLAAKSWDGNETVASLALANALDQLTGLSSHVWSTLEPLARPEVTGGGQVVGHLESRLEMIAGGGDV